MPGEHHSRSSAGETRSSRDSRVPSGGGGAAVGSVDGAKNGVSQNEEAPPTKLEDAVVLKPLVKTSNAAIKLTLNSVSLDFLSLCFRV